MLKATIAAEQSVNKPGELKRACSTAKTNKKLRFLAVFPSKIIFHLF